jgi:hypothetical protein
MKKFLISSIAFALGLVLLTPSALAASSADTESAHAREYAQAKHVLPALENGDFAPEGTVTKIDLLIGIVDTMYPHEDFEGCFANITSTHTASYSLLFRDVPTSAWYAKHVCIGMFTGIINGQTDGNFYPEKQVTAAEASTMVAKAYGLLYPSKDIPKRPWYQGPMEAMKERNAIPSNMHPEATLHRSDIALMFYRLRNQERFPARRTIGTAQTLTIALSVEPETQDVIDTNTEETFASSEHNEGVRPEQKTSPTNRPKKADKVSPRTLHERVRSGWRP